MGLVPGKRPFQHGGHSERTAAEEPGGALSGLGPAGASALGQPPT